MFLQVAHAAVDDGADGAAILGSIAHEAAVDCVYGFGGGGDEEDGVWGESVDLDGSLSRGLLSTWFGKGWGMRGEEVVFCLWGLYLFIWWIEERRIREECGGGI